LVSPTSHDATQHRYKKHKKSPFQSFTQFKMATILYAAPGDTQQSATNVKCPQD